ncbi:MAG: RNase adapter RapZ [Oscillospiraceae bacterium]|jgi:UPF0042 nucleotide-binding protein|nr:RNase adapter RapZ [Oscillospiraceae bacterium]
MRFLVVTGLSGAGKSKVVDALEDTGWFCVDNLPPRLAATFVNLLQSAAEPYPKACVVMDARAGGAFLDVFWALDALLAAGTTFELLFLDAADDVLARRFQETRRQHPLCAQHPDMPLADAISAERRLLEPLRRRADLVMDTSATSPTDCKNSIVERFSEHPQQALQVHVTSFGFKAGTPRDCDLLFDVRCLPNPFYVPELKEHTGLEPCIRDYVLSFEESRRLLEQIAGLLEFTLPLYQKEGKSTLTIAFGCTGGRHRSVLFAEEIGARLRAAGYAVHARHRELAER